MHVTRAQIGPNHVLVCDHLVGAAFGNLLPVIEHHDVPRHRHDRAHHVLNDDDGQPALRKFANERRGSVASARAISSRRWSIVVKSRAGACSLAASPTNAIASRALARATSSFLSRRNAPVITLAKTVIPPNGLAT